MLNYGLLLVGFVVTPIIVLRLCFPKRFCRIFGHPLKWDWVNSDEVPANVLCETKIKITKKCPRCDETRVVDFLVDHVWVDDGSIENGCITRYYYKCSRSECTHQYSRISDPHHRWTTTASGQNYSTNEYWEAQVCDNCGETR